MIMRKGTSALLAVACSTLSLSASADTSSFELGAYSNFPGGKEIAARDYAGAIKAASAMMNRGSTVEPLVAATNLCVAYTATGAFHEARGACDRALELARREDAVATRRFGAETATSRALSNRGVLRAMNGDAAGAALDFRAAAKLKRPWIAAVRNLTYLETRPGRVASAESE